MDNSKRLRISLAIASAVALLVAGCGTRGRYVKGVAPTDGPEITDEGVRFSIFSTRVERVCIAGDFNNWSMTADPMVDREGTGLWTIVLPLAPGRYEYKFVLDGEKWIPDPGNMDETDDGFGGVNSVVTVD